jgi:signal transduction histidine kinase
MTGRKLIDQFTGWFLAVTVPVLLGGGMLVFFIVQREIIREDARRLEDTVKLLARNLRQGTRLDQLDGYQVHIEERDYAAPAVPLQVTDTSVWFPPHEHYERELRAVASYKMKGKHYYISASNLVAEPDEIARGVVESLSWTFVLLIVVVGLLSRFLSRRLLVPFNQILTAIGSFSVTRQEPLRFAPSSTREFEQLNQFLGTMTAKAAADYQSLKEFTENASHELQTPLAVIRGKLELLMETDIDDKQAGLILAAHNAVEKLAKTNQALTLLTKLENQEYRATGPVDLGALLNHALEAFRELFDMKRLVLQKRIEANVHVRVHPELAPILLNNLLSNAIRHNQPEGRVSVTLTARSLLVENTGKPPQIPTESLFERFKKSNQSDDSIGLGLAIVKQICELNDLAVSYHYRDGWHRLEVRFAPDAREHQPEKEKRNDECRRRNVES